MLRLVPAPTNYTHNFYPHEPLSYCFSPYHHVSDCLEFRQFSNLSCEQMNINFSNLGFNFNSNFYNLDWSNHPDFSWQAQAMGNYALQYHELHHPEYLQFDHQSSHHSSYNYPAQELSLEDTLKAFIQESNQNIQELNQNIQELQKVTMSNSQNLQELR
jgi:hypothetical protein